MQFVTAKSMLTKIKDSSDFFPRDYNMNIYRGCSHGCIYCDSRSLCYQIEDFGQVRGKENALELLEHDLKTKRNTGIIGTGSMSDPYNQCEEKYELTRDALKLIDKYGFGVGITTKSALITRDIDLLQSISKHSPAHVSFSITTSDDEICKKIEPNVSLSSERFKAIKELSENGIYTGVWLNPVLPFITDDEKNIVSIIKQAYECGAKYAICYFGVTMRAGNREYFYKYLDKHFPSVKEKYIKTFGDNYICNSPNSNQLLKTFETQCDKYGLIYDIKELNKDIRNSVGTKQMSLFDI